MQMDPINWVFLIGDFAVAVILVLYFTIAYKKGKLSRVLFYAFWIGCIIGATWEFTFMFLGDGFAYAVNPWPFGLSGWPKKLAHSVRDGGLFMTGVLLCRTILGRNSRFLIWNWYEFGIMELWGISQELLVEYLFNGRVWVYVPLSWNPVIISPLPGSATTVGYTLIPQAVWVIAPIVFYYIFVKLHKRFGESHI